MKSQLTVRLPKELAAALERARRRSSLESAVPDLAEIEIPV
jgi:hypothetical protein